MPASPRPRAPHPTITLLQTSSLAERGPGRARADDPVRRAAPRREAHRDGARRPPRRLARPAARSVPHARRSRASCAPRRTAASSSATCRSTKRSRSSTCARRWTSSSAAASPERSRRRQLKEIRALVDRWSRRSRPRTRTRYHLLNLRFHDRLVELAGNGKLTAIYRKLIKELSLFRRLNLGRRLADADLGRRAPADRQGDRLGRRRRRRARDVRPRHGKQGANDQEPPAPPPPRRAPAANGDKAAR